MKPFWRVLLSDNRGYNVYPGNRISDRPEYQTTPSDLNPFTAWISAKKLADTADMLDEAKESPYGFFVVRRRTGSSNQADREMCYMFPNLSPNVYDLADWSRTDWIQINGGPRNNDLVLAFDSQFPNPFKNLMQESRDRFPALRGTDLDWQCYTNPRLPLLTVEGMHSHLPGVSSPYSYSDHMGIDMSKQRQFRSRPGYGFDESDFRTRDGEIYRIDDSGQLSKQKSGGRWGPVSDACLYVPAAVVRYLTQKPTTSAPTYIRIRYSGSSDIEVMKVFAKSFKSDPQELSDWRSFGWKDASTEPTMGLYPVQLWEPSIDLCGETSFLARNMEIGGPIMGWLSGERMRSR